MRVIIIGISRDIEYDLRNDLFRHLVELSPDYYGRVRTGDIMARATNDLNAVRMMLGPGIMYWTETSLTFLLAIVIMVTVDWRLAVLAILPAPLVSLAVIFFGRAIHARFERIQAMFSDISSRVQENLAGVRMVRAFVQEQAEMRHFEKLNRAYIAENIRLVRISGVFQPLLEALIGLTFLAVLWYGGGQVLTQAHFAGQFRHVQHLHGYPGVAHDRAGMGGEPDAARRRLTGAHQPDLPREALHRRAAASGCRWRGCAARSNSATPRWRIPPGGRSTTSSLTIEAGTTVAVVGHTGSGKSTLVEPGAAADGPHRGTRAAGWHRSARIYRPRNCGGTSDSCRRRRFCSARPSPGTSPSAWRAPRKRRSAGRRSWPDWPAISSRSRKGYETMVGERGITLSGGQKQRTAIARAILRNPRILILDDALSSVDTLTEERILEGLEDAMRGRTVILISHRVSTVRQADRIVVLEHGRIVEQGTHAELVSAGGYYADLSRKQMLEEELEAI